MNKKTLFVVAVFLLSFLAGRYWPLNAPVAPAEVLGRARIESTYQRTYFGAGWADLDKDGEDTREEILKTYDVDHIVALKEAFISGASKWTAEKRKQFANDMDNLQLLPASVNRSKGDKTIVEWLPECGKCEYATIYLKIKNKWGLRVEPKELVVKNKVCSK